MIPINIYSSNPALCAAVRLSLIIIAWLSVVIAFVLSLFIPYIVPFICVVSSGVLFHFYKNYFSRIDPMPNFFERWKEDAEWEVFLGLSICLLILGFPLTFWGQYTTLSGNLNQIAISILLLALGLVASLAGTLVYMIGAWIFCISYQKYFKLLNECRYGVD